MARYRTVRVDDRAGFDDKLDDYLRSGYRRQAMSDEELVYLCKPDHGLLVVHVVLLLFAVGIVGLLFTAGIGNLLYAMGSNTFGSDRVMLRLARPLA